jgi:putative ABC transport system permease protein
MTALNRKLIRDLAQMKGQTLAICLVMASGVAMFIMSLSTLDSLVLAQATYYERYRFADVFAHLKRAPNSLAARIAELPGVARVQTRVVREVNLDVAGLAEPAIGRILSLPEHGRLALNEVHLREGRYPEPGRPGEVLVGEAFAQAHRLRPGDNVRAVINGRLKQLHLVGVVLSPEYVIQIREPELFPDDKRFGVFWMNYREIATAFDIYGAFNDLAIALTPGASREEVIRRVDLLIARYGGLGAYGREEQVSNRFLTDEIQGLRQMGLVAPVIFLGVAAFLLNVVLSRLITTQREEIAALKAFGYTRTEIGWHYLKLALLIALLASALGVVTGLWLGRGLTDLYARFYRFPGSEFHPGIQVILQGLLVSLLAATMGVAGAVRRAMKLPPAEAMRPQPPPSYRPTVIERLGLQRLLAQTSRMILRNLERHPIKALLSSFGIALAAAILVLGSFMKDALDRIMEFQFQWSQLEDMTLAFVEPLGAGTLHEVGHLPGVLRAESFRTLPVRLRARHRSRRVGIMGLEFGNGLFRLLNQDGREAPLAPAGLVLSQKLAELLDVKPGDTLIAEVMEGKRPVRAVRVSGVISDFSGINAYMNLEALHRLAREGPLVSGAFLDVDPGRAATLSALLKTIPKVAGVTVKAATLKSFYDTVAENFLRMRLFNIAFASIIAFGVVYNSARISLSERSRELATLRVLGFTRAEISLILLGEQAVLTLAAIPFGLALGYGFAALMSASLDTELYRIPLVVKPATFAFASSVIAVAALISGLIVRRRLDRLDLVAVLKSRE